MASQEGGRPGRRAPFPGPGPGGNYGVVHVGVGPGVRVLPRAPEGGGAVEQLLGPACGVRVGGPGPRAAGGREGDDVGADQDPPLAAAAAAVSVAGADISVAAVALVPHGEVERRQETVLHQPRRLPVERLRHSHKVVVEADRLGADVAASSRVGAGVGRRRRHRPGLRRAPEAGAGRAIPRPTPAAAGRTLPSPMLGAPRIERSSGALLAALSEMNDFQRPQRRICNLSDCPGGKGEGDVACRLPTAAERREMIDIPACMDTY